MRLYETPVDNFLQIEFDTDGEYIQLTREQWCEVVAFVKALP